MLTGALKGIISTTGLFGDLAYEFDRSKSDDPVLAVEGLPLLPVHVKRLVVFKMYRSGTIFNRDAR